MNKLNRLMCPRKFEINRRKKLFSFAFSFKKALQRWSSTVFGFTFISWTDSVRQTLNFGKIFKLSTYGHCWSKRSFEILRFFSKCKTRVFESKMRIFWALTVAVPLSSREPIHRKIIAVFVWTTCYRVFDFKSLCSNGLSLNYPNFGCLKFSAFDI